MTASRKNLAAPSIATLGTEVFGQPPAHSSTVIELLINNMFNKTFLIRYADLPAKDHQHPAKNH